MKRHFIKKYIFTVIFMLCLFVYAGINLVHEIPTLADMLKDFDWKNIDTEVAELESTINDNVYQKYTWIETFGTAEEVIGTDVDNGFSYVKSTTGALNYTDEGSNDALLQENIQAIQKVNQLAAAYGATPIVLLAPDVYVEGEDEFREGIPYLDKNEELDKVREAVEGKNIVCVDSRDYLEEIAEWTNEPIFFDTDHHWRIKPAFYMAGILMDEMDKSWNGLLNPNGFYSNIDNYNVYTYEDCFLGSMGRETGIVYAGLDDIDLIYPKYETNFVHTYKSTEDSEAKTVDGEFVNSILDIYNFNNADDIYLSDKYSTYLDSVNTQDYITNVLHQDGPRVLVIRDSFMAPTAAFLANVCSEMDMVWSMRYTGDLEELICQGGYDYVIVELGSTNLNDVDLLQCIKNK